MNKFSLNNQAGFSLIELTIALIIISILIGVALQQMTSVMDDSRQIKTEREMEILANSIVGNPDLTGNSGRTDFGYVGGAEGKVSLYAGKTLVRKNIPQEQAEDALVALIHEHGKWTQSAAPAKA